MTHPYRSVLDRVEIVYECGRYGVTFKKLITPLGPEKVRSVFAKIDVSVFPDDPELTNIYYARNPLKLSDISFRASTVVNGESVRLGWRVVKQHSSCIEIDISLEDEARDKSYAVNSDGSLTVEYSIDISRKFWGNYLERHVMREIDRLEVCLRFPAAELKSVSACKYRLGGTPSEPIRPPVATSTRDGVSTTEWALERPTINDRFRFYWYFVDGSENHLQQEFKRSETRRRLYSADGSAVLVHGKPYVVSESQKKCLDVMFQALLDGELLHQSEILKRAGLTKTKRLKDLFARHATWDTIIRSRGKAHFALDSQIKVKHREE